ncbi:metal ABC transporter ATP-binding protein [Arcanobacterium phocisimile]|uniref:Metal ABC transporter ATP-binding protein n=1 Tax=Arcanobacterium phocisimile TaxID=1302235 RepID=A0ABX7IF93_9ACTO|nr:metal ABC transporter ATP-binding protein [Arcanobacterium phocisimile]QRV01636.1 metal ABC transporter ATP-binding protein [Arcanobacterium phocisimile]
MDTQNLVLDVRNVHVAYGEVRALTGIDFAIDSGKICAIVGMNGSGKSTFFKSIMGLVRYQQGDIRIVGQSSLDARRAGKVGYVPQNEEIDSRFPLSIYEVVMMGRYGLMGPLRKPSDADRAAVNHALDVVGLTDLADRPIGALSGGQRKRAFVARAVAQGAELMLLDEPFAGVDYTSAGVITELLQELAKAGATLLVSTHDLSAIPDFADEVALLNRKIVGRGDPRTTLNAENLKIAFTQPEGLSQESYA